MIGIDVLTQKRDLARATGHLAPGLGDHIGRRTRIFGPARVGDDTKAAELVAALLHRQEGGKPLGLALFREKIELGLGRKFGVDQMAGLSRRLSPCLGDESPQPVIGLRTQHDIDEGRTALHFLALRLGNAAGNGDRHIVARRRTRIFQRPQPAQFRINLFRRLLANMACVEDDDVRLLGAIDRVIPVRRHDIRHPGGVINIHLAAVGFDEKFFGQSHQALSGRLSGGPLPPAPVLGRHRSGSGP